MGGGEIRLSEHFELADFTMRENTGGCTEGGEEAPAVEAQREIDRQVCG